MGEELQYPQGEDRNRQARRWTPHEIRALREHLKLTQSQMAEELQVRQQTISEWETGTHKPHRSTQKTLSMIAERAGFFYSVEHAEESLTDSPGEDGADGMEPPASEGKSTRQDEAGDATESAQSPED